MFTCCASLKGHTFVSVLTDHPFLMTLSGFRSQCLALLSALSHAEGCSTYRLLNLSPGLNLMWNKWEIQEENVDVNWYVLH